jgi:hypothetical protein
MPTLPSITTNRPSPLRAASASDRSAATWASRSKSKTVLPPQGRTLADGITTNPSKAPNDSLGARLGLAPTRATPFEFILCEEMPRQPCILGCTISTTGSPLAAPGHERRHGQAKPRPMLPGQAVLEAGRNPMTTTDELRGPDGMRGEDRAAHDPLRALAILPSIDLVQPDFDAEHLCPVAG